MWKLDKIGRKPSMRTRNRTFEGGASKERITLEDCVNRSGE